jgi:hypothetical protein
LTIFTSSTGLSVRSVFTFSIKLTTSMPLTTRPNTVCLLSSQGVGTVVMKNWLPLVLGPAARHEEWHSATEQMLVCVVQPRGVHS